MMFSKTHPSCPRFLYHPTSSLVLALEFIPTNYHLYIPNSMKHHLFNLMAAPRGLPGHNVGLNPQPGKGHVGRPRDAPADGEAIWLEELHVLGEAVPASQLRVHRSNAQLHIVGPGCHSHPKGHGLVGCLRGILHYQPAIWCRAAMASAWQLESTAPVPWSNTYHGVSIVYPIPWAQGRPMDDAL